MLSETSLPKTYGHSTSIQIAITNVNGPVKILDLKKKIVTQPPRMVFCWAINLKIEECIACIIKCAIYSLKFGLFEDYGWI